jgi:hypothetical protein
MKQLANNFIEPTAQACKGLPGLQDVRTVRLQEKYPEVDSGRNNIFRQHFSDNACGLAHAIFVPGCTPAAPTAA